MELPRTTTADVQNKGQSVDSLGLVLQGKGVCGKGM